MSFLIKLEEIKNYKRNRYNLTKSFLIIAAILIEFALIYFIYLSFQSPFIANPEILKQFDFKAILTLIIATLSTILAIVFAVSQFILSNIVDKYSIQIIEKYEKSPKTRLFAIDIFIIIFTFFLLATPNLNTIFPFLYMIGITISLYFFIISFIFLNDYIKYMFTIINPSKFADEQKNDVIKAIINQNEEDLKQGIIAMGDITYKLMKKGEEKVCLKYLNHFNDIFQRFMELRDKNPEKYQIIVFRPYERRENKNNLQEYILNEYLRLYKESITAKQDKISQKIVDNLYETLNVVMYA